MSRDSRRISMLLSSELLGALGVESFNITVVWHLVKMLGTHSAYYLAIMLLAAVISGVLGGRVFDRFRPFQCAAVLNLFRVAAAALAITSVVYQWPLMCLLLASLCLSASRPHLDAAIFGGLTTLGLSDGVLHKANARVDNTARLARIAGPALAALMAYLGSEILALVLTLGCFMMACALQWALDQSLHTALKPGPSPAPKGLMAGFRAAWKVPALVYCFVSQLVNAGAWYLGFVFSTALLLSATSQGESLGLGSFAIASLCYGLGNIAGNLWTSRLAIERPLHFVLAGRAIAALGYLSLAAVDTQLVGICFCAMLIACGTPPADLSFLKMLQRHYDWQHVAKLYRVKMVSEYAGMLVGILAAPSLLAVTSPAGVIALCGMALGLTALAGYFLRHGLTEPSQAVCQGARLTA